MFIVCVYACALPHSLFMCVCVCVCVCVFCVCVCVCVSQVCFKTLDDNHLSAALQMGPHLHRVSAQQLCLQSDQHADKEWLWPVLALTGKQTTDMTSLLKLPKPSTYKGEGKPVLATGGTWNVHATEVSLFGFSVCTYTHAHTHARVRSLARLLAIKLMALRSSHLASDGCMLALHMFVCFIFTLPPS